MKVRDLMTAYAPNCRDKQTISEVKRLLLPVDPGPFPVVDRESRVVGVLRESDIRGASSRFGRIPEHILVFDAMFRDIRPCLPSDDVDVVLKRMTAAGLSRFPVVDASGRLVGAVAIVDRQLEEASEGPQGVAESLEPSIAGHRSPSYTEQGSPPEGGQNASGGIPLAERG